mgnify:CR=1 FL=1
MKDIKNKGFTLIEILVSLAILGIVLAGIYSVYNMQHKSYIVQEQVAEMQQNERIALQMITRDIRTAGLGLACKQSGIIFTEDANGNGALNNGEDINGDTLLTTFGDGQGFDGSDTIALAYYVFRPDNAVGGNSQTADNFNPTAATFHVIDATGFTATEGDNLVIIYNQNNPCNYATVAVTNVVEASGTLTHAVGKAIENLPGGAGPGFSSGDRVRRLRTNEGGGIITYRIGNPDGYTLYRTIRTTGAPVVQPLADNIEDLQIAYGFDINGNGVVELGEWFNTPAGQDMTLLREIRVTLVARTIRDDPEFNVGTRPPVENHAPATNTTEAKYRRRVLQTTIKLRNIDGVVESF